MKKYIKPLALFFVGGIFFSYSSVFASRSMIPWDYPICKATGTIESVSFEDEYNNPCLDIETPLGYICPTDVALHHPARYSLGVKIESFSYVKGETEFSNCEQIYKVGSVKNIDIDIDKVKEGDTFSVNQKIEGINSSSSSDSFDSYVLKTDKKPRKDIPVAPKKEEQIYKTNIIKNGKLFFFIPISLNIQTTVDLTTGIATTDIIKVAKKPWWSFLLKF